MQVRVTKGSKTLRRLGKSTKASQQIIWQYYYMSSSSTKKEARTPIVIGILVAAGAIAAALIVSATDALKQPALPENPYPSIEIEMPKTTYAVGERLDFAIHTYGICASPNVTIWRDTGSGESMLVFQRMAAPISCPPPDSPDQPHLIWQSGQLVHRISDESFGGEGNSFMTSSAAFVLKKTGDYVISASLPDRSKSDSANFTVTGAATGNRSGGNNVATQGVKCQQSLLCTYQLMIGSSTYPINFRMNGTIHYMSADIQTQTLTITLSVEEPTSLQMAVPREVVDSRAGVDARSGPDEEFAVFLDDVNVKFEEIPVQAREWTMALGITENAEKYRILIIPIPEGTVTVEIVGTWLI